MCCELKYRAKVNNFYLICKRLIIMDFILEFLFQPLFDLNAKLGNSHSLYKPSINHYNLLSALPEPPYR